MLEFYVAIVDVNMLTLILIKYVWCDMCVSDKLKDNIGLIVSACVYCACVCVRACMYSLQYNNV